MSFFPRNKRQFRKLKFSKSARKASIAIQALALAKKNSREIKRDNELQYTVINPGSSLITLSTTPNIQLLNATDWQVTGNFVMFKGIEILGHVLPNIASTVRDEWRVDIVLDRRPDGAVISILDLYADATPLINALVNVEERSRYKILKTWRGIFNVITDKAVNGTKKIAMFKRFNMKLISDDANEPLTQARIQTNALYMIAWTQSSTNAPILDVHIIAKHTE